MNRAEAITLAGTASYSLIVIDEESLEGRTPEIVRLARARREDAELVIVSRDFPSTTASLGELRVRHLVPKPLNVHVLAAVLGRTALALKMTADDPPPPPSVR